MLVAVVGQTFHGRLASGPDRPDAEAAAAPTSSPGASASLDLLREAQQQVDFPLMVPTVIERSSWIDREKPIRVYYMDRRREGSTRRSG